MATGLLKGAFRQDSQLVLWAPLNLIPAVGCLLFNQVKLRKWMIDNLFFGLYGKCFPLLRL